MTGSGLSDRLIGNEGNDKLNGRGGDDVLKGGTGNDSAIGGGGRDDLSGGRGDDTIKGQGSFDRFIETANADLTLSDNEFHGTSVDVLSGIEFAMLTGGRGDNIIDASAATFPVVINGRGGNDRLIGGSGNDRILGGAGDDEITGGGGNNLLNGQNGTDVLVASISGTVSLTDSVLKIGKASSRVRGMERASINGGDKNDRIDVTKFSGKTKLFGGAGDDELLGGRAADVIDGGAGNDLINGGDGADVINGGGGDDVAIGGQGNDRIRGGAGRDVLMAGLGDDKVNGQGGEDKISGGLGKNRIIGLEKEIDETFKLSDDLLAKLDLV